MGGLPRIIIKKCFEQVRGEVWDEYDAKIKIGINAISNNDYNSNNDSDTLMRFKIDRVRCNSTGLNGIITADGEEVVPCIFDYINIHLDGYVEAVFKGIDYNLMFVSREMAESLRDRKEVIFYSKTGAVIVKAPSKNPLLYAQLLSLLSK